MIILLFVAKMLITSGLLYGYYYLFLRNKRFHQYNRLYIILSTAVSIIIPFLRIPVNFIEANDNVPIYQTLKVIAGNYNESENTVAPVSSVFSHLPNAHTFAWLVYATGFLVLLFIMITSLRYIRSLSKKYAFEQWQDIKFYNTLEEGTPFSFFRSIFWNEKIDPLTPQGKQIFRHELYHVRNLHSADILFMELICIIGWFNPFFYLARKELKAIHEFLADQYAVSGNDRYEYAELLVVHTIAAQHINITNNFFNNHIKRRITMLTNFSTIRYSYWSRIMSLPLGVLLICFISLQATAPLQMHKTVLKDPMIVVIDAGHGGVDPGAKSNNGIIEKDICLDISKKIQELSAEYNIKVVMTRDADKLPGNSNNANEGLKNRVLIAGQTRANLFISIHINYDPNKSQRNGFEVYVPSLASKNPYLEKSKIAGSFILSSLKDKYFVAPEMNLRASPSIFVLNNAPCPAILLQCGYLSNSGDLNIVTSKENQEGIARKILEGIVQYGTKSLSISEAGSGNGQAVGARNNLMQEEALTYILNPAKYTQEEFNEATEKFLLKGYRLNLSEIKGDDSQDLLKILLKDNATSHSSGATFRINELKKMGYVIVVKADKANDKLIVRSEMPKKI